MLRNKIILVPFPYDDLSAAKVRPAVCLTEPIGPFDHIIVAFISSRLPAVPLPTDLVIDSRRPDFAATRLRVSSTVQMHRLLTITTSLIERKLGNLPPTLASEIEQRLRTLFNLS